MNKLLPLVTLILGAPGLATADATKTVDPDASFLVCEGMVHRQVIGSGDPERGNLVRSDRVIDMAGKGYRWDNPGACLRFRTDAREIVAELNYSDQHISQSARNGVGVYSVDGVFHNDWKYDCSQKAVVRRPEVVSLRLAGGETPGFHDYAIYLPYGDSVDFGRLKVNPEARFESAVAGPPVRYVAYGDSVTQGFSADGVQRTFPFLLGQKKGWQTFNLGWGGRSSTPDDGRLVAQLNPDVITVLIGGNDWQTGVPLEKFRANMGAFFDNIRAVRPQVPIYLITHLWVAESWNPKAKVAGLEDYRRVQREVVVARHDPNLFVVEGSALIDHDTALFDQTPVHPRGEGFMMMVERLAPQIRPLPATPAPVPRAH